MDHVNQILFSTGLLVVVVGAALLLVGVIESGVVGAMLIIGIGLIAASGNWT